MNKYKYLIFFVLFHGLLLKADVIKIASIDWCPQLCPKEEKKDYVLDILEQVFKNSKYKLDIKTYPWSRAIMLVNNGTAHALLSPAKNEAPNLVYPQNNVGTQQMCFFSKIDYTWQYKNSNSLKNKKIGIAKDTSLEELNSYIQQNKTQFQSMPYGQNYIKKSLLKLDRDRFDTFLFTKNSTIYKINSLGLKNKYKISGCLSPSDIYIAFSPKKDLRQFIREISNFFDKKISKIKQTNQIHQIFKSYGLE